MNNRYAVEQLPNGLIRVFDRASQLAGYYHADGMYCHGDLRVAMLAELLGEEQDRYCEDYPMEEVVPL